MTKYTGTPRTVNAPAAQIASKFEDLTLFSDKIDKLPEQAREKISNLRFTKNTISMDNAQIGTVTFTVTECTPKEVRLSCDAMVPINVTIELNPVAGNPDSTEVVTGIEAEVPAMLRPLIGPALQKAANSMGDAMGYLANL